MFKKIVDKKAHSFVRKSKNIQKHLRIANATKNEHEKEVHLKKVAKLQARYKI